jgi:hypothetical protein
MATRLLSAVIDATDHIAQARWWGDALRWDMTIDQPDVAAISGEFLLEFVPVSTAKTSKNRLHFDLVASDRDREVERLTRAGAKPIDIGQGDVAWVVMADPEGNEFCVVPLNDEEHTGLLGAIAHDAVDPHSLGRFWSEASGWPIVIDGDWGVCLHPGTGPYLTLGGGIERTARKLGKNRIHLDVAPPLGGDQLAEVARLESLGARRIDIGQGNVPWVVMADPEDNEFCVLTPR